MKGGFSPFLYFVSLSNLRFLKNDSHFNFLNSTIMANSNNNYDAVLAQVLSATNRAQAESIAAAKAQNDPSTLDPSMYMHDPSNDVLNSPYITDPILKAFLVQADTANTRDRQIEAQQQFTEYLIGEQNYRRSLEDRDYHSERNQLARLMGTGMSRAAAMQALTGAPSAQSSTSVPSMSSHSAADMSQLINSSVQGVTQFAQLASQLYSLPFDINTKRLTNRLLSTQSYMLDSQRLGLDAAAAFSEAVANANAMGANLSGLSLQEQFDYFVRQASMTPASEGFDPAASAYGMALQSSGVLANPFFWSALSGMRTDVARSDASMYEPERMRAIIQQQHAATTLAKEQSKVFAPQVRILNSDAFVAEMTQDMKIRLQDAESTIASVNAGSAQSIADANVAHANYMKGYYQEMLDILPTISAATLEEYSFRLSYLETLHDPAYFESERNRLVSSNEYDAVVYTKLKMIESFKESEISDMLSGANPEALEEYRSMVREGTALIDLYGETINDQTHKWIRDAATAVGIGVASYSAFRSVGRSKSPMSPAPGNTTVNGAFNGRPVYYNY